MKKFQKEKKVKAKRKYQHIDISILIFIICFFLRAYAQSDFRELKKGLEVAARANRETRRKEHEAVFCGPTRPQKKAECDRRAKPGRKSKSHDRREARTAGVAFAFGSADEQGAAKNVSIYEKK